MKKKLFAYMIVLMMLLGACHMLPEDSRVGKHADRTDAESTPDRTAPVSEPAGGLIQGLKEPGLTVDKLMSYAPWIFEGICLSRTSKVERGTELEVQVQKDYSGRLKESEIVIVRTRDGASVQKGSSYLFFTEAYASVYEHIPLMFHTYAMTTSQGKVLGEDYYGLTAFSKAELENRIMKTLSNPEFQANWQVLFEYCYSEDPKDIYGFSTHAVIGKVESIDIDAFHDRTSYYVSVEENRKGKAQDKIVVVAFKDSLKIGESYLFLLSGTDDPDIFTYTLAGINAVFPPDYEVR
ncbi:MAG: hypothetical protein J6H18_01895 [Lachnospiraceae bacterium]|nr:hypothetical protein [Lachnospiraceae bacterium]